MTKAIAVLSIVALFLTACAAPATQTPVPVVENVNTPTPAPTATFTPEPTVPATPTATLTATNTSTHTPSPTGTSTPSPTASSTQTPTPTPTVTQSPSSTPSPTSSPTTTDTPMPTATPLTRIPRSGIVPLDTFWTDPDAISSLVWGANYWEYGGSPAWSRWALEHGRSLRLTLLRWGGIARDESPITHSTLDEFMRVCRSVGAEPMIQVPLHASSPDAAAETVRYANLERDYHVRFWEIGNEPDIYDVWEDWGPLSCQDFTAAWRSFAEAMKQVDPSIILVGPDLSWKYQIYQPEHDWLTPFVQANGDLLGVASVHFYPSTSTDSDISVPQLLESAGELESLIAPLEAHLAHVAGRRIPVAVTEANLTWDWNAEGDNSVTSYWAALWWADVVGRMIDSHMYMGAIWSAHGGDMSMIYPWTQSLRPTYYAFRMYANYGDRRLPARTSLDRVRSYAATVSSTRYITIVLINQNSSSIQSTLRLGGSWGGEGIWAGVQGCEATGMDIELPAYSVASLIFNERCGLARKELWSKGLYDQGKLPLVTEYSAR